MLHFFNNILKHNIFYNSNQLVVIAGGIILVFRSTVLCFGMQQSNGCSVNIFIIVNAIWVVLN